MSTPATISITPGAGQLLDAVSLTVGLNTVVRETMVIADPTNATQLAGVTAGGALLTDASSTVQPISGTITANQGTSPWIVGGSLTHNNTAPSTHNLGVLSAIANVAAPTFTEGDQVLLSTDLTGALRVSITGTIIATNNIEEWNSVALGSPSAYGTGPGAVNVIGVNAFITNAPNVTNTGTFAVQASITTLGQQLAAASVPVVLTAAQIITLTPPTAGAIGTAVSTDLLIGTQGAGSSVPVALPTATITTLTPPTAGAIGTAVSGDLLIGTQTAAASVPVALPTATITTLTPPTAATIAAAIVSNPPTTFNGVVTQSTAANLNATVVGTGTLAVQASITTLGQQLAAASVPVVLTANQITTLTPLATVAVTQSTASNLKAESMILDSGGTNLATVKPASTAAIATDTALVVAISPNNSLTLAGTLTHNNAAPAANNLGVLPAVSSAAGPSYTEGDQVLLSVDSKGRTRVHLGITPYIIQKAGVASTGSVASQILAYGSNVLKGTTLVVVCAVGNGTTPTVTDSAGNTYSKAIFTPNASAFGVGIFYTASGTAGANTVTVTPSGSVSVAMEIYELNELLSIANSIGIDGTSGAIATGTAITSNSVQLRAGEEFALAGFAVGTTAETINVTATPGNWVNDSGQLNPTTPAGLFSFASASTATSQLMGSISANATIVSKPHACCIVVFRQPVQVVMGTVVGTGPVPVGGSSVGLNPVIIGGVFTGGSTVTAIHTDTAGNVGVVSPFNPVTDAEAATTWSTDGGGNSLLGVADCLYNGSTFDRLRTNTIFKTASVPATASGNTAVWTPTSGKKFRLMRFQITGVNLAATAATVITVSFQDSATPITIGTYDVLLPATATSTGLLQGGIQFNSGWIEIDNGFLSASANNVLNCNISATVTGATGSFRCNVCGTEE